MEQSVVEYSSVRGTGHVKTVLIRCTRHTAHGTRHTPATSQAVLRVDVALADVVPARYKFGYVWLFGYDVGHVALP